MNHSISPETVRRSGGSPRIRVTLAALAGLVSTLVWTPPVAAQVRVDGSLTGSRFEQQVKTEIGGARGERLVEQTEFGVALFGTYDVWGPLSVGLFAQFDAGLRNAGRFDSFDAENRPIVVGEVGGGYTEFWAGPLLRARWKQLFVELGYGLVGLRSDDARDDLTTADGDVESALRTSRTVAYLFGIGAGIPINKNLQAVLRIQYRIRYYDRRSGDPLVDETVHGTQNLTPFIGLAWRWDRR